MASYRGTYEHYEIEIDGLVMLVSMPWFNVEKLYEFANEKAQALSAGFRDTIGYIVPHLRRLAERAVLDEATYGDTGD